MSFMTGEIALQIRQATGRDIPQKSAFDLLKLPAEVLRDVEVIYQRCGSVVVFAYLYHVTGASFGDVKTYLDGRGWASSVD